jgi:hypothetical protein
MPDSIQKMTKAKKGWGCGSRGRAPDYQAHAPEFRRQYCQKKKDDSLGVGCFKK